MRSLTNLKCSKDIKTFKLEEICTFNRGTSITKNEIIPGDVPVIAGGQTPAYYCNKSNRSTETITVSSSGAYAGYVAFWDQPIFVSDAFSVDPDDRLDIKYLYYFLKTKQEEIHSRKKGGGVPHVHGSDIAKLTIKIPPLHIQKEIVRILDQYSAMEEELEAKLEAELDARVKQYEHYQSNLLTFSNKVERKKLNEIAKISNGKDHKSMPDGNIPVYGSGGIMRYANTSLFDQESVLIPRKGSVGNIFYVNTPFWTVDTIFYTKINCVIVNPKYLYYFLKEQHLEKLNIAGGVPSLTKKELDKISIPVPTLEEQEQIISILDLLNAKLNDLKKNIQLEKKGRKQQYEYYRDKLLTFKELQA